MTWSIAPCSRAEFVARCRLFSGLAEEGWISRGSLVIAPSHWRDMSFDQARDYLLADIGLAEPAAPAVPHARFAWSGE